MSLRENLDPDGAFSRTANGRRDLKQQDGWMEVGGRRPAADSVLATEEKRWSRRRRDALSWFISNGNKAGNPPPAPPV